MGGDDHRYNHRDGSYCEGVVKGGVHFCTNKKIKNENYCRAHLGQRATSGRPVLYEMALSDNTRPIVEFENHALYYSQEKMMFPLVAKVSGGAVVLDAQLVTDATLKPKWKISAKK